MLSKGGQRKGIVAASVDGCQKMTNKPKANYKAYIVQDQGSSAVYFTKRKPTRTTKVTYIAVDLVLLRNELHSFMHIVKREVQEREFSKVFKASWRTR
jgi:hypothetical protein